MHRSLEIEGGRERESDKVRVSDQGLVKRVSVFVVSDTFPLGIHQIAASKPVGA